MSIEPQGRASTRSIEALIAVLERRQDDAEQRDERLLNTLETVRDNLQEFMREAAGSYVRMSACDLKCNRNDAALASLAREVRAELGALRESTAGLKAQVPLAFSALALLVTAGMSALNIATRLGHP